MLVHYYGTIHSKKEKETAIGQMCIDVFGEDWEEFEIAHLATSDGIGIELFTFPHGVKEVLNSFQYGSFLFVSKIQISKTSSLNCILRRQTKNAYSRILSKDKPFKCAT
jgi:hypothetical protein